MIDILRAVQWWDEWQLRILVLGSLGLQWFLLLAAPMRNYTFPRLFGKCIWLAYVSADALAIYALATLFNRHARASGGGGGCEDTTKGSSLEVLWAPLLLVYLGGREEITAYTIEDNELWTRHTVTLVSQVTVAVYAFCKSWPGSSDRKLLLSAILLFVIGIISFIEKPWALRRASIKRLVAMSSLMKGKRESPAGRWDWCFTEMGDRYKCWKELPEGDAPILSQGDQVQMILSDLSLYAAEVTLNARSKAYNGDGRKTILEPLHIKKDETLKPMLRQAFGLIYTRANVIFTPAYLACHVMLVPSLYIAAIMLFAASRKRGYGATDVRTTYVLLCFTAVLDVFGLLISELMYRLMSGTKLAALCENVPGSNLVDWVHRTMKRPVTGSLLNYAMRFGYYDKEEGKDQSLYHTVSEFITAELVRVTTRVTNADFSSYRSFTNTVYWTKHQKEGLLNKHGEAKTMVWKSLRKRPFDASVVIWHIATDLCFRSNPPKHFGCRPPHVEVRREVCTEAISNYMAYLLNSRPDMLMTGSRQHLFTEATTQMAHIITQATKGMTEHEKRQPLSLHRIKEQADILEKEEAYTIINDACELAKELLEDDDRWNLMYRVWVGMLCYSASMCRGYLHAKSLGEGGEFLSYVWLVISLQGAKTLADKLQMPDKERGDDDPHLQDDQKPEQDQDKKGTTMPE